MTFRPGVEIYDSPNVSDDLDRLTHVSLAIIGVASIEKKTPDYWRYTPTQYRECKVHVSDEGSSGPYTTH